jgi:hypothetical protein
MSQDVCHHKPESPPHLPELKGLGFGHHLSAEAVRLKRAAYQPHRSNQPEVPSYPQAKALNI